MRPIDNPRQPDVEVDPRFPDRWSPRAFSPEPVAPADLEAVFEAARWAPSANNEQPWRFVFASTEQARRRFVQALVPFNQQWAQHAPVLIFVLTRRHFVRNSKPNRWAAFDAGAAWMALALAARGRGLYSHAMGGFDQELALQVCGVDGAEYEVMAAVALGRRADPARLDAGLREREQPSGRKPMAEVAAPVPPATLP